MTQNKMQTKALRVHKTLIESYGEPENSSGSDPVASLVNTILSQNTNDRNRDVAYRQLRERYPTWEAVRDAPTEDIVEAIRPAGLGPSKGPRIQQALQRITEEQGEITLDFLREMPLEEARAWLLEIKGVGPKTAAIVLLFALNRPAFPVDTHVHRVTKRLGLIPEGASREQAHEILEGMLPQEIYYPFHLNLIRHGRRICEARSPQCERCPLQADCDYYQRQQREHSSQSEAASS
jgi:endonuclease III